MLSAGFHGAVAMKRNSCLTASFLHSVRLLTARSPLICNYVILKRLGAINAHLSCSSPEERDENNKKKRDINNPLFLIKATGGTASQLYCIEETSNKSIQPLQRVQDTVRSITFTCLVGILLIMDLAQYLRLQQMFKLHLHEPFTVSFTFLFLLSAIVTALLGCLYIPFLRKLNAYQILRKEGPSTHVSKAGTPTMGGVYFVTVGATVAAIATHTSCTKVTGLITATLVFGAIGLIDDMLGLIKKHNYGLSWWCKLSLQVIAGIGFTYWNQSICLPTLFRVKTLVRFPPPFPHLDFGCWYLPLTAFCFASMSNGVNLTDGLDGLAAGTAAAGFVGMALALFLFCPALAVFGVSMAGACVGFLVHNHHKAEVFMGDTGSLALGGALAAMAGITGMFLPLLICSGIFLVETLSVILQVSYKKWTKRRTGVTKRLFRMAPIHHHFELGGVREPTIVFIAHAISCSLAVLGGYVGFRCLT